MCCVCRTLTAEQVSVEILSALRTGRDAVTPGLWNKAYLHGIAKILPAPALAALHQVLYYVYIQRVRRHVRASVYYG